MLKIGQFNSLKVIKTVDFGVYLDGGDDGEILLPIREAPEDLKLGDELDAFIYFDSEDRLIATTLQPLAQVGDFALLEVVGMSGIGAFLDWGLQKDLFLPFAEQSRPIKVGDGVVVAIYLDKSDRISASMRVTRYADKSKPDYESGDDVDLLIFGKTDLGFKAIVDNRFIGVIYKDEVFIDISYGQQLKGFIKELRPDGKIDLRLNKIGRNAVRDEIEPQIVELLKANKGFYAITDKTPAEKIYELFGVSKKKYKIALGGLYKKRVIRVEDDGIYLV